MPRFELGYLPLAALSVGDPVVLEFEEPPIVHHTTGAGLLYNEFNDTLVALEWVRNIPVAIRPADLSRPPTPIETSAAARPVVALARLETDLPTTYTQVVPAIGNGPGAFDTYWRSDLWLFNPSDTATEVVLRRVARPAVTRTVYLAAHASLELRDVHAQLGGGPTESGGDGIVTDALVVTAPYRWGSQVVVHSRNYTPSPDGLGTYGQSIPAVPTALGYSTHLHDGAGALDTHGDAPEFVLDLRSADGFRHNLGVVNDGPEPLLVDLYYGHAPTAAGVEPTHRLSINAHSVANISLEVLVSAEMRATRPSIVKIAASRPAPVWLSMIDNKTGDATFLPFALFGIPGALDATMAIPQVANTPGANGTYWRSDLYGVFHPPVSREQLPRARFYPGDPARCAARAHLDVTLIGPVGEPGNPSTSATPSVYRRIFPDVVAQVSDCTTGTMGALELNVGSWMAGFTRTYTTREDGGTYGDVLPLYPPKGWPVQHFSGITVTDGFRINIGLYNGLDYTVAHRLTLYDDNGTVVRIVDVPLGPRRSEQSPLSGFLGAVPPGLYGLTVTPLDASSSQPGRSRAYVAIVDNSTGDTTNLW